MDPVTIIGLMAATCTTMAFLPQVFKIWRTRSVEDLSLGTFSIFSTGVALWLAYGILIEDIPVIIANLVTLVLQSIILVQLLRYRSRSGDSPESPLAS